MNEKPEEAASAGASAEPDSPATAEAKVEQGPDESLKAAVDGLKAENADLRDKLLRSIAEMENFRRRADREKADLIKYAVSDFARDAVSIGDNLKRAIEAAQKDQSESPALRTLLEGVEVTERELHKVLERHGVSRFDALGEKFDPHVHEAMIKVDVPNVPADTVVQVLQSGYKIGDRVLRPAAVIVAKGGTGSPAAQSRRETEASRDLDRAREHDPDVVRDPSGVPRTRKDRAAGDKRTSSVTKPVTDGTAPHNKDDLISSFGKRMENGS
jgi:molecular chaperone GrpE